jgi:ribonuclease VapC
MVIDTSAIIAILLREPDAPLFAEAIENGTPRLMSAATLLEASMVIETRKVVRRGRADSSSITNTLRIW